MNNKGYPMGQSGPANPNQVKGQTTKSEVEQGQSGTSGIPQSQRPNQTTLSTARFQMSEMKAALNRKFLSRQASQSQFYVDPPQQAMYQNQNQSQHAQQPQQPQHGQGHYPPVPNEFGPSWNGGHPNFAAPQPHNRIHKILKIVDPATGAVIIGDTDPKSAQETAADKASMMPAKALRYCGKKKNQCRCGKCDGRCGPSDGCPCNSCLQLSGLKYNSEGSLCQKGVGIGDGGDTAMTPESLYYCGEMKMQCRCRRCDGQCGPQSGCPCNSCVELVGFKVNGENAICKMGAWTLGAAGGDTELPSAQLYYCGKRKEECRCGRCESQCGPRSGCPCRACLEVVGIKVNEDGSLCKKGHDDTRCQCVVCSTIKPTPTAPVLNIKNQTPMTLTDLTVRIDATEYMNNRGDPCVRGGEFGTGGDTGLSPRELLYCGMEIGECRCGDCDRFCGPENGCPCNACLELVYELILDGDASGTQSDSAVLATPIAFQDNLKSAAQDKEDSALCIICLERKKEFILLPCGHYSYCGICLEILTSCAICREKIASRVKVYEA